MSLARFPIYLGARTLMNKNSVPLMDILKEAQKCSPSYIRSFALERQLDPEVKNILDRIPHFSYNLTKGFLQWSYGNGLQEGTFSDSIDTERFQGFQDWIKRNRPTTFEEIEGLLL